MFTSVEHIKAVGEKYEKGTIVPNHILKAVNRKAKKNRHKLKFACDVYRFWDKQGGYTFFADCPYEGYVFKIKNTSFATFAGDCYGKKGNMFIGGSVTDENLIETMNKEVFGE